MQRHKNKRVFFSGAYGAGKTSAFKQALKSEKVIDYEEAQAEFYKGYPDCHPAQEEIVMRYMGPQTISVKDYLNRETKETNKCGNATEGTPIMNIYDVQAFAVDEFDAITNQVTERKTIIAKNVESAKMQFTLANAEALQKATDVEDQTIIIFVSNPFPAVCK